MPRSRPKVYAHRRHKKVLKFTKGQKGSKHLLFRRANEAMLKSLFYAFRDRRNQKRDFRRLVDYAYQCCHAPERVKL